MPTPTPATLIYNAKAGSSRLAPPDDLRRALQDAGYAVDMWLTTSPDPLAAMLDSVTGTLFLAGGDGTIRTAALHLLGRTDIVIGVIPMGTANNVARALNVHGDVLEVARQCAHAHIAPFDVGRVSGSWGTDHFIEACGCGLFAEVLDDYNPDLPKSPMRAAGSMMEALSTYHPHTHQVSVDGQFKPGPPLSLLEIMNTPSTGNGLHLAPRADPTDGQLDLVRVNGLTRTPLLEYLTTLLRGTFHEHPSVNTLRGTHFTIHDYGQVFHVDTAVRRSNTPGGQVEVSAWAGALRVLKQRP